MAEGWDPSLALRGAPEGNILPNPLEFFGKMQMLQQQQNENLKFRQDNDARVAVGDAYKRAIDPASGRLDEVKLLEILRGTEAGNVALPGVLSAAQARAKEASNLQTQQLDLSRKRIDIASGVAGGLLSLSDGELTKDKLIQALARAGAQYGDPELLKMMFLGSNDFAAGGAALRKDIVQAQTQMLTAKEQLDRRFPAPQLVDTGGQISVIRTDGFGNTPQVMGQLDKTATLESRNALVPATNAIGAPIARTREEVAPMAGRPSSVPPPPGQDRVLGLGTEAAADLTASTQMFNSRLDTLNEQIIAGQKNMQEIEKMRGLLEGIGTGPMAPALTLVSRYINQMGFPELANKLQTGASPAAVSEAEAFMKKSWSQGLSAMKQAMPAGKSWTGQEVFANYENNPNITMTPQAIRDLFDFEAFRYKFLKEEQSFRQSWRMHNPAVLPDGTAGKSLRQAESDWSAYTEAKGWVKPLSTGTGEGATGLFNAPLVRGAGISNEITAIDLSMIPRGATRQYELDDGSTVKVRRGNKKEDGNTYTVVR